MTQATTRPEWLDARAYPFDSQYLDVDGHRVHYVDEGRGPLLLFVPGGPTWSFVWRDVIKALRPRFRCVALDFPGFGLSVAADNYDGTLAAQTALLERFVLALDLRDITMVGHDTGTPVGLTVATRQPARFDGFVISHGFAWPLNDNRRVAPMLRLVSSPPMRVLLRRTNMMPKLISRGLKLRKLSVAEQRGHTGPHPDAQSRWAIPVLFADILRAKPMLERTWRDLPAIADRPALLVWGSKDPGVKAGFPDRFKQVFPDHELGMVDGAAHFVQEEDPHAVAAAIADWHARKRPGAAA